MPPPNSPQMARLLMSHWRTQAAAVSKHIHRGAKLTLDNDALARKLEPLLARLSERGYRGASRRSIPSDVKKKLAQRAKREAAALAKAVNQTTTDRAKELGRAIAREQAVGGDIDRNDISRRVDALLFDRKRSTRIAANESLRAFQQGRFVAMKDSGEPTHKRWIAKSGPCDICKDLDGVVVSIDQPFMIAGSGRSHYDKVMFPPAHPNCRCDFAAVTRG